MGCFRNSMGINKKQKEMKVENYAYYEVEVTVTKKITITLDFDELDTDFSPKNYTVEDYAIDDVINGRHLSLGKKDITKVEIKKSIR
jgi:hypothetical protein